MQLRARSGLAALIAAVVALSGSSAAAQTGGNGSPGGTPGLGAGGAAGDLDPAGDGGDGGLGGTNGAGAPGSGAAGGAASTGAVRAGGGGVESGGGGGSAVTGTGGGGGGGGGRGATLTGAGPTLGAAAFGGDGGAGGAGIGTSVTSGGGGGGGGNGLVFSGTGTLTINAAVRGGEGGAGGAAGSADGLGGGGGAGGNGVVVTTSGVTLDVNSPVNGGFGGATIGTSIASAQGAGGVGIIGSGLTINLASTVTGGLNGNFVLRNFSLQFTGGANTLNLNTGWGLSGNIRIAAGSLQITPAVASATIAGSISGAGAVSFTGGNTVILTNVSSYSGGTTIGSGTTLQLGNGGTLGSISGSVFNSGTLVFNRSDTVGILDGISGSGQVRQVGSGVTMLLASNTYLGGTTITAGELWVGNGGTIGFIQGNVANDATLVFNRSITTNFTGQISGTGVVRQAGSGTTVLTGNHTYTGGTTISAGTLQLGSGGLTGSIVGDVVNDATLAFNRSNISTFVGTISGTGALRQIGTGTTILTADNTYTGGTTVSAGTLQLGNGGATGSIVGDVAVNAGATFAFNRSSVYVFAGTISGGGALRVDAGSIRLTGTNTYSGGTSIGPGATLSLGNGGATGSVVGDIVNNGTLVLFRSGSYQFGNVVTGTGGIAVGGGGTAMLTGASTFTGGSLILLGSTLQIGNGGTTGSIVGDVSNEGTLAFNRSDGYRFDGAIVGNGAVRQIGTGTTVLTGASSYTGATSVLGGALIVNGSIAASSGLTVAAGALVGGTGTLPTSLISGSLSPGNSVGTINVAGNLSFAPGGSYLVEIEGPNADRTNVTGTASLAGTIRLIALGGTYAFNTRYTVLNALGGVSGTFAAVSTSGSFGAGVTSSVSYDPNNVFVTLVPAPLAPIVQLQLGPNVPGPANAVAVAAGIDRAVAAGGDASPFFPIYNLPASAIPAAVNQLSGEVHSGAQGLGVLVSGQFLATMLDPYAFGRVPGSNPALAYAPADVLGGLPGVVAATQAADLPAAVEVVDTRRFAVWAAAFGSDGRIAGDAGIGSARRSERSSAIAAGADFRVLPGTVIGFALAGGGASASLNGGLGSTSAEVFQAGAYAMTRLGFVDLSAALAYSRLEVDTTRTVPVLGITALNGSYDAEVWSGRIEAAVPLTMLSGLSIAPFSAFQAQSVDVGAFAETSPAGALPAALAVDGRTSTTSRGELGARFETRFGVPGFAATAFARVAWAHYFERDSSVTAALVGLPGSTFTVIGARPDRDSALVSAGVDVRLTPQLSIGARFDGEFSENVSQYAGTARIRFEF